MTLAALAGACGDGPTAGANSGTDSGTDGAGEDSSSVTPEASTGEIELDRIPIVCPDEDPDPPLFEHEGDLDGGAWTGGVHVVSGFVRVTGPLDVGPCVAVVMRAGASLVASDGGSIALVGEPGRPVLVTSAASDPQPGDWGRIEFTETSTGPNNRIEHARVEYGGHSERPGMVQIGIGAEATIVDSTLTASETYGFVVAGALEVFTGNDVSGNYTAGWVQPNQVGQLGPGTYGPSVEDGIVVPEGWVRTDQTWRAHDAPYVLENALGIGTGQGSAHLTLEAGVEIRVPSEGWIEVDENGGLTTVGTEASPVRVHSAKSVGAPGDWHGIRFESDSVDAFNQLDGLILEHGGWDGTPGIDVEEGASVAIRNCTLRNNAAAPVLVDRGADLGEFVGNTLTDNGMGIRISANAVGKLGVGTYGPNDSDGILILDDRVQRDATWLRHDVPYVIDESLSIRGNGGSAGITVAAGAQLGLLEASIFVEEGGWLAFDGTAADPVVVTSAKAQPAPADWRQLRFEDGSVTANNVLRHARIEYGGGGGREGMILLDGGSVTLDNVTFAHGGQSCDVSTTFWGAFEDVSTIESTFVPCE